MENSSRLLGTSTRFVPPTLVRLFVPSTAAVRGCLSNKGASPQPQRAAAAPPDNSRWQVAAAAEAPLCNPKAAKMVKISRGKASRACVVLALARSSSSGSQRGPAPIACAPSPGYCSLSLGRSLLCFIRSGQGLSGVSLAPRLRYVRTMRRGGSRSLWSALALLVAVLVVVVVASQDEEGTSCSNLSLALCARTDDSVGNLLDPHSHAAAP